MRAFPNLSTLLLGLGLLAALATPSQAGTTYYVEPAPNGDDANPGTQQLPFETIAHASSVVQPGETIMILGGPGVVYDEPIVPVTSGEDPTTGAGPITYEGHGTERPRIVRNSGVPFGNGYCIHFQSWRKLSHVVIRNVECDADGGSQLMDGYAVLQATEHVEIRDSVFTDGSIGTGIFTTTDGTARFNKIVDNLIAPTPPFGAGGVDVVYVSEGATQNLIEGNDVRDGVHSTLRIDGPRNVIRDNVLSNPDWTVVNFSSSTAAERNVFEGNEIYDSDFRSSNSLVVLQIWSPRNIFRRNLVYSNGGTGLNLTRSQGGVVDDIRSNHIYHNVFRENGIVPHPVIGHPGFHLRVKNGNTLADGNVLRNNVFELNHKDTDVQILIDGAQAEVGHQDTVIATNVIRDTGPDVIDIADPPAKCEDDTDAPVGAHPIATWEACFPSLFTGNTGADPTFVNAANGDFRPLGGSSPLIDGGSFLTLTTAAGTDTTQVPVGDAGYFFDGYGIPGVSGDTIQIGTATATVTAVDDATNTLTLDAPVSFGAGYPVSLPYAGLAPDIGAIESTQCNDGIDNDGDGKIDFDGGPGGGTADPQCPNAIDNLEANSGGPPCGLGFELALALPLLAALRGRGRRGKDAPAH